MRSHDSWSDLSIRISAAPGCASTPRSSDSTPARPCFAPALRAHRDLHYSHQCLLPSTRPVNTESSTRDGHLALCVLLRCDDLPTPLKDRSVVGLFATVRSTKSLSLIRAVPAPHTNRLRRTATCAGAETLRSQRLTDKGSQRSCLPYPDLRYIYGRENHLFPWGRSVGG